MYLSDLRSRSNIPFVRHAAGIIDAEKYGADEWNDAVRYITGKRLNFELPADATDYLAGRFLVHVRWNGGLDAEGPAWNAHVGLEAARKPFVESPAGAKAPHCQRR